MILSGGGGGFIAISHKACNKLGGLGGGVCSEINSSVLSRFFTIIAMLSTSTMLSAHVHNWSCLEIWLSNLYKVSVQLLNSWLVSMEIYCLGFC